MKQNTNEYTSYVEFSIDKLKIIRNGLAFGIQDTFKLGPHIVKFSSPKRGSERTKSPSIIFTLKNRVNVKKEEYQDYLKITVKYINDKFRIDAEYKYKSDGLVSGSLITQEKISMFVLYLSNDAEITAQSKRTKSANIKDYKCNPFQYHYILNMVCFVIDYIYYKYC